MPEEVKTSLEGDFSIELELPSLSEEEESLQEPLEEPSQDVEEPTEEDSTEPLNTEEEPTEGDSPPHKESDSSSDNQQLKELAEVFAQYIPGFSIDEDLTEDSLRKKLEEVPDRLLTEYVNGLPEVVRDFILYQASQENPNEETIRSFYESYVRPRQDLSSINVEEEEGAEKFLRSLEDFQRLYDTKEEMDDAIALLKDKETLIPKAKKLKEAYLQTIEEKKKEELARAQQLKEEKIRKAQEFQKQLSEQLEQLPWSIDKKKRAISQVNQENIQNKMNAIISSPKALIQLGDILSYFDENEGFDSLYEVLEGKEKSRRAKKARKEIEKDALGTLLRNRTTKEEDTTDLLYA